MPLIASRAGGSASAFGGLGASLRSVAATGFVSIDSFTFPNASSNTITFSDIPQTYRHLFIIFQGAGTINDGTRMRFNGDSTNGNYREVSCFNGTVSGGNVFTGATSTGISDVFSLLGNSYGASQSTGGIAYINDYSVAGKLKQVTGLTANINSSGEGGVQYGGGTRISSTEAITSFTLVARTQNFDTGSTIALFGIS